MSSLPMKQEILQLEIVIKKAELDMKNRMLAKEQLLRIQLILAKRVR